MWAQVASTALGLWLMAAPAVLGFGPPASTVCHVVGPLVASASCIAIWAATRGMRWLNVPLSASLVAATLVLGYDPPALVNNVVVGAVVVGLAFVRGQVTQRFGGGWAALLPGRDRSQHAAQPGSR